MQTFPILLILFSFKIYPAMGDDNHVEIQINNQTEEGSFGQQLTNKRKNKITVYLVLVAAVCSAGSSLQFGYNLSVINTPQLVGKYYFQFPHYYY